MMTIREERGIRIGLDRVKKNNTELKNGMQSEDGYMPFFVFGKNRIRISEHFESIKLDNSPCLWYAVGAGKFPNAGCFTSKEVLF